MGGEPPGKKSQDNLSQASLCPSQALATSCHPLPGSHPHIHTPTHPHTHPNRPMLEARLTCHSTGKTSTLLHSSRRRIDVLCLPPLAAAHTDAASLLTHMRNDPPYTSPAHLQLPQVGDRCCQVHVCCSYTHTHRTLPSGLGTTAPPRWMRPEHAMITQPPHSLPHKQATRAGCRAAGGWHSSTPPVISKIRFRLLRRMPAPG